MTNFSKFFLTLSFLILISGISQGSEVSVPVGEKVCIHTTCFETEWAVTDSQKIKGLMGRDSMELDEAMIFIYDEERIRSFWMKNMNFPIDIFWIDQNFEIVDIHQNIPECTDRDFKCETYRSSEPTQYILEMSAGSSERYKINLNDKIYFKDPK